MSAKIYLSSGQAVDPNNALLPFDPVYGPIDSDLDDGTLLLIDPSHSVSPLSAVPGTRSKLPNIAQLKGNAGTLLGDSTASLTFITAGLSSTTGAANLTPKKALQGIITQTAQTGAISIKLTADDPVKNYVIANPNHWYLIAVEELLQRPAILSGSAVGAAAAPVMVAVNSSGLTANMLATLNANDAYPQAGNRVVAQLIPGANAVGENFMGIVVSGWTGNLPALSAFLFDFGWGTIGSNGFNNANWYNKFRSSAGRRWIFKDLTVAGKATTSAATADLSAIYKNWQRKVSPGGLWYGDTPVDPSVIP